MNTRSGRQNKHSYSSGEHSWYLITSGEELSKLLSDIENFFKRNKKKPNAWFRQCRAKLLDRASTMTRSHVGDTLVAMAPSRLSSSSLTFEPLTGILNYVPTKDAPPVRLPTKADISSTAAVSAAVERRDYRSAIVAALSGRARSRPIGVSLDETALDALAPVKAAKRLAPRSFAASGATVLNELKLVERFLRDELALSNRSLVLIYGSHQGPPFSTLQFLPAFTGIPTLLANSYLGLAESLGAALSTVPAGVRVALFVPEAHAGEACTVLHANAARVFSAGLVALTHFARSPPPACPGVQTCSTYATITGRKATIGLPYPGTIPAPRLVARQDDAGRVQLVEFGAVARESVLRWLGCFSRQVGLGLSPLEARLGPFSSGDAIVDDCHILQGAPLASWVLGFSRVQALSSLFPPRSMMATPPQLRWLREEWALKVAVHSRGLSWRDRLFGGTAKPSPVVEMARFAGCATGGGAASDADLQLLREAAGCQETRESWGSYETLMIGHGVQSSSNHSYRIALDDGIGVTGWTLRSFGPYDTSAGVGQLLVAPRVVNRHPLDAGGANRAGSGGRQEGKWYALRDIVEVRGGPIGSRVATVSMVDKTTFPFQLPGGEWVATGRVERVMEAIDIGGVRLLDLAWITATPSGRIAAVVWPTNQYARASNAEVERLVHRSLRSHPRVRSWEIPSVLLLGDEPWEYRPRAKVRSMLVAHFGPALADERLRGVALPNPALRRHAALTSLLRSELAAALDRVAPGTAASPALAAALAGCVDGACLLRNADGSLREPELRHTPYDAQAPLTSRLHRYDDEPWHLWDLAEARGGGSPTPAALLRPLRRLCSDAHALERLRGVLPPVLPSLGILHKLGMRFRLRLHCACALATQSPPIAFRGEATSASVQKEVLRVCRPEWAGVLWAGV